MRKNFLILMLMALLPLAGYAVEASFPANAEIDGLGTYTYSGEDQKATIVAAAKVKSGSDDLTSGATINIYTDAACTTVAATVTDAGTYYVGAYGNGTDYVETALVKKSFTVGKKAITVTAANTTVNFGDLIEDDDFSVSYSGWATGSDGTASALDSSVFGNVTFTSNYVAGTTAVGASSINITPVVSGLTSTNYSFTPVAGTVTVNARALTADMITLSATSATYNGADQLPTVTITDGDYEVTATSTWVNSSSSTVTEAKAVDTYTLTVTGIGNWTGAPTKTFTINKKTLYVKTKSFNKVYDATTFSPTASADYVKLSGLVGDDTENYSGLTVALGTVDGLTTGFDAGTYPINVSGSITSLAGNYNFNLGSVGTLTISKKAITITANDAEKDFGDNDDYANGKLATSTTTDATAAGTCKLSAALAGSDVISTQPTLTRTDGETAGTYPLTPSAVVIKNSSNDVTKNYDINYTAGTFTINATGFTIWADDKTSQFGADIEDLTATAVGIPAADAAKIIYGEGAITTTATSSSNRGTYAITIDKTKIDFSAIEDLYDIDAVTVVAGEYEITPAPLKIKAADQSHKVGETVTAASAETIEFVTEGVSEADQAAVIAGITLKWGTLTSGTHYDTDGKLIAAAATSGWTAAGAAATEDADMGIWYGGIAIDATTYNASTTANYTLDAADALTAGKLTVTAADADVTLYRLNDDATKLPVAVITANEGKKVTAKFGDRALTAKSWNAFILPFEISVATLSQKVGYAVVNVLNKETSTTSDVRFELEMGTIPANTPFLMKTAEAKNMSTVTIEDVVIVKPASWSCTVTGETDAAVKFIGNYEKTLMNTNNSFVVNGSWMDGNGTGSYLNPLAAYVEVPAGTPAPQIYVQDIDGSVTAISTITAEGVAVEADGWYTVNGMKLEGAPTEKGIYIRNGKKFVVK